MAALSSVRILRKHWKLTAIAVLSLAVAMALGVLSLSLSNTFLLMAPTAPQPDHSVYGCAPGIEHDGGTSLALGKLALQRDLDSRAQGEPRAGDFAPVAGPPC